MGFECHGTPLCNPTLRTTTRDKKNNKHIATTNNNNNNNINLLIYFKSPRMWVACTWMRVTSFWCVFFMGIIVLNALAILGVHQLRAFNKPNNLHKVDTWNGHFFGISIALHIHFGELFLHLLGLKFRLLCHIEILRSPPRPFKNLKKLNSDNWVPLQDVWI